MQAQIQALLVAGGGVGGAATGPHMEMAKLAIFNGEAGRVGGFVMVCRSYMRMKIRERTVEE